MRSLALVGAVSVATMLLGPVVLVLALLSLALPGVRGALRPLWSWGVVVGGLGLVAITTAVIVAVPDGRLPIPPGAGLLTSPRYVGAAAEPRPVPIPQVPQHPWMASNGTNNMHVDAYATDTYAGPGPLGRDLQVDTAWFGIQECATLTFDRHDRIVALCGDVNGPALRILDPETMRPLATTDLPDRPPSDKPAWKDLCAGAYFYLDQDDRAVVATTDRRVLVFETSGADGTAELALATSYDLAPVLPAASCLIALMPDWSGRIWFEASGGAAAQVGFVDPATGEAAVQQLAGEELANSFSVDEDGGVYVVSDHALYRFAAEQDRPVVAWRVPYDRGSRLKPGQLSRGSGTTPTIMGQGRVAITDNADPQMNVVVYDRETGRELCSAPVFGAGHSATENSLVAVGDWLFVENNYGYDGPQATVLGRITEPGLARVDVTEAGCSVAWTNSSVAPTSVPKASAGTGLLYAYTTRRSLLGVSAWYFTAIDLRTGATVFSRRTGIGALFNNHYAAVTLAPDGSAYVATLAGLVRVRDTE